MEPHHRRDHQIDMNTPKGSSQNKTMKLKHNTKQSWLKKRHFKQWQRKFYDFIYSNVGMAITLAFACLLIYGLFGFISNFIQYFWAYLTGFQSVNYINSNIAKYYNKLPFCHHCSDVNFRDNIRNAPLEHSICFEPMDIVYTWVNGSDPRLQTEVSRYKQEYLIKESLAKNPNWTQPVGIKFTLLLHGGTLTDFETEYWESIETAIRDQLRYIVLHNNPKWKQRLKMIDSANKKNNSQKIITVVGSGESNGETNGESDDTNGNGNGNENENKLSDNSEIAGENGENDSNNDNESGNESQSESQSQLESQNKTRAKNFTMSDLDTWNKIELKRKYIYENDEAKCWPLRLSTDYYIEQTSLHTQTRSEQNKKKRNNNNGNNNNNNDDEQYERYRTLTYTKKKSSQNKEIVLAFDKFKRNKAAQRLQQNSKNENNTNVNTNDNGKKKKDKSKSKKKEKKISSDDGIILSPDNSMKLVGIDRKYLCVALTVDIVYNNSKLANESYEYVNMMFENYTLFSNLTKTINGKLRKKYDENHPNNDETNNETSNDETEGETNNDDNDADTTNNGENGENTESENGNESESGSSNGNENENDNDNGKEKDTMSNKKVNIPKNGVNYTEFEYFEIIHATKLDKNSALISNITVHNVSSDDTGGKGRYRDNEELRYSLRSVWKFAPWVRNIYIVTNGQVPHWLNLNHPRIKIVTHSDIFANSSYLPTFASPSIEANLHRIPGLSSRFIYLNDDVMFGNDVFPDDFWRLDGTQNVFLSWEVPRCAEGCPNNWIKDGYCDAACNNRECDWDGGDCNPNATDSSGSGGSGSSSDGSSSSSKTSSRYCASGCPVTWIGDKVCDRACQDAACGYDGGDCGLAMIKEHNIYSIVLDASNANHSRHVIPEDISAFYIDFGNIFYRPNEVPENYSPITDTSLLEDGNNYEEFKIVHATHDHAEMVRSAIVTQIEKIVSILLHDHDLIEEKEEVEFDIAGYKGGKKIHYIFTIERRSKPKPIKKENIMNDLDTFLKQVNLTQSAQKQNDTLLKVIDLINKCKAAKETTILNGIFEKLLEKYDNDILTFIGLFDGMQLNLLQSSTLEESSAIGKASNKTETGKESNSDATDNGDSSSSNVHDSGVKVGRDGKIGFGANVNNFVLSEYYAWINRRLDAKKGKSSGSTSDSSDINSNNDNNDNNDNNNNNNNNDNSVSGDGLPFTNAPRIDQPNIKDGYGNGYGDMNDDFYYDDYGDYGMYDDWDDANMNDDFDFYDGQRRRQARRLLSSLFENENHIKINNDCDETLNTDNNINDIDYKIMRKLGWIDDKGNWLIDKSHKHWNFLDETFLSENVYFDIDTSNSTGNGTQNDDNGNNDESSLMNNEPVLIDGYVDESRKQVIFESQFNESERNRYEHLRYMKEKELANYQRQDIERISNKLNYIFEKNDMIPYPWIIYELSIYLLMQELEDEFSKHSNNNNNNYHRRKLLDTYADSLRHVNRLYNKHFGAEARSVPAHMPHAVDKHILTELIDTFCKEFDITSSHRFRHAKDMQWAFSYYYYVMSAKFEFTVDNIDYIFDEYLDLDHDGFLNAYEEQRMINEVLMKQVLKEKEEKEKDSSSQTTTTTTNEDGSETVVTMVIDYNETVWKKFFHRALWNITHQLHDLTYWHPNKLTIYSVNYTVVVRDYLIDYYNSFRKFKSFKHDLDNLEFYMIKDDPEKVETRLKDIYNKKPKFMCLNDDMPHDRDPSNLTLYLMKSFFYKYFPYPSPFEIVPKNYLLKKEPLPMTLDLKDNRINFNDLTKDANSSVNRFLANEWYDEYHPYCRKDEMIEAGYWDAQKWDINEHYNSYFELTTAKRENLYKTNKRHLFHHYSNENYYRLGTDNDIDSNMKENEFGYNGDRRRRSGFDSNNNDSSGSSSLSSFSLTNLKNPSSKRDNYWRAVVFKNVVLTSHNIGQFWSAVGLFVICSIVVFGVCCVIDVVYQWLAKLKGAASWSSENSSSSNSNNNSGANTDNNSLSPSGNDDKLHGSGMNGFTKESNKNTQNLSWKQTFLDACSYLSWSRWFSKATKNRTE